MKTQAHFAAQLESAYALFEASGGREYVRLVKTLIDIYKRQDDWREYKFRLCQFTRTASCHDLRSI